MFVIKLATDYSLDYAIRISLDLISSFFQFHAMDIDSY